MLPTLHVILLPQTFVLLRLLAMQGAVTAAACDNQCAALDST